MIVVGFVEPEFREHAEYSELVFGFNLTMHCCHLLFVKTGGLCKVMAEKLPGQLVERLKESIKKKIALGR